MKFYIPLLLLLQLAFTLPALAQEDADHIFSESTATTPARQRRGARMSRFCGIPSIVAFSHPPRREGGVADFRSQA